MNRIRPGTPRAGDPQSAPPRYRKLHPCDLVAIEAHFLRLETDDRACRFLAGLSDSAINRYCDGIDWGRATLFGCFIDDDLRGIAELVTANGASVTGGTLGEVALSVEKPFRRQGIATELLRRARQAARNRLVRSLDMLCVPDNRAMLGLARKLGATLKPVGDGVSGRFEPLWPTYFSVLEEAAADGNEMIRANFESCARFTDNT